LLFELDWYSFRFRRYYHRRFVFEVSEQFLSDQKSLKYNFALSVRNYNNNDRILRVLVLAVVEGEPVV
jgi:hypothetical protein